GDRERPGHGDGVAALGLEDELGGAGELALGGAPLCARADVVLVAQVGVAAVVAREAGAGRGLAGPEADGGEREEDGDGGGVEGAGAGRGGGHEGEAPGVAAALPRGAVRSVC